MKSKLSVLTWTHTLAIYNSIKFEELAFEQTLKKFIEAGYPAELKKLKFDHDFVIRGLMVDCERGNILKVDGHKYVKVAYHGHKKLEKKREEEYIIKKASELKTSSQLIHYSL